VTGGANHREGSAPSALVHATSVVLGKACIPFGGAVDGAVLLLGASGSGKSDVALRLIGMGAQLLSDDQTMLFAESGRLLAEAPRSLYGRIEIRGVGIVTLESAKRAGIVLMPPLQGFRSRCVTPFPKRLLPLKRRRCCICRPSRPRHRRRSPPLPQPSPGALLSQGLFRLLPALFSEPNAAILRAIPHTQGT
jgi:HPr Serine kinase C-terminal domain